MTQEDGDQPEQPTQTSPAAQMCALCGSPCASDATPTDINAGSLYLCANCQAVAN